MWVLSLPLVAVVWLAAHALTHVLAGGGLVVGEAGHHAAHFAPLCAGCATCVVALLLAAALLIPVFLLGYELVRRVLAGLALRPLAFAATPPRPAWLTPDVVRPSVLATGGGERAPPRYVLVHT
jgi:hypothetical protein